MDVAGVVELRVHGVSGTPPEELLDRPLVRQVAGDQTAGFYRPRLDAEARDDVAAAPGAPARTGPELEGYAWGGLTSGAPSRALWLLLLPFTLINVAPRMRPPDRSPRPDLVAERSSEWTGDAGSVDASGLRLMWYLCRVLAVALTMSLTLAVSGVGLDLLGWQCGRTATSCADASPQWLVHLVIDRPLSVRLMLGALLPVLVLIGLSIISGRTIDRYEHVIPELEQDRLAASRHELEVPAPVELRLGSLWMWRGEQLARRLRQLHLQAGVAMILAVLAWPVTLWLRILLLIISAATLVRVLVGLADRDAMSPINNGAATVEAANASAASQRQTQVVSRFWVVTKVIWTVLAAAGVLSSILLLVVPDSSILGDYPQTAERGGLRGYGATLFVLFTAQVILALVLLVVVWRMRAPAAPPSDGGRRARAWPTPGLAGLGTPALAGVAVLLGALLSAGAYLFSAAWLFSGSLAPSVGDVTAAAQAFRVPDGIRIAALVMLAAACWVVLLVVIAAVVLAVRAAWRWAAGRRGDRPSQVPAGVAIDYSRELRDLDELPRTSAGERQRAEGRDRIRAIGRIFAQARLVDRLGAAVGIVFVPVMAITVVGTVVLLIAEVADRAWLNFLLYGRTGVSGLFGQSGGWKSAYGLQGIGAYLVVATLLGLVALGAAAFRVRATRRSVGMLWDLASFWPRAGHPLAAACYAERTVPELFNRIHWYVDERRETGDQRAVVLAGHSQGTVISAAVLRQLAAADNARLDRPPALDYVAFLSFGCVLRRLYGRYFSAYFTGEELHSVAATLRSADSKPRWRNLWRRSDYLGGAIGSGPPAGDDEDPALALLDQKLVDPQFSPPAGDLSYPAPGRHSDFWEVREFQCGVLDLAAQIQPPAQLPPPRQSPAAVESPTVELTGHSQPRTQFQPPVRS